jgi:hypothetical protein
MKVLMKEEKMKVKLLNNCGYSGLDGAVGKVISAAPREISGCFIYGRDLIEAGAIECAYSKSLPYAFAEDSIEIIEQASPDEAVLGLDAVNEMTLKALKAVILGEPDPFEDVFDGEI